MQQSTQLRECSVYAATTTRTVPRNGIAPAFDDGMFSSNDAVAWAALAAIAAYTTTCSFAAASTISDSTIMVVRATLTLFAGDSASTPAGRLSAADVLTVAAAVALAAPSSPRLAVVGPAAAVIPAGGRDLAVARVAGLARSLAVVGLLAAGALPAVAPARTAGITDAAPTELRAR